MPIKSIFLTLSIIAACISPLIGIYTIVKGNFRPQRMTRLLYFLISLLFVGTLWAQGDHNGIYIASAQLFGSTIILALSMKKGMGGRNKSDIVVFLMAILALIVWKTTQNPTLGLSMSIVTDLIAFYPTLIKTWKYPETEAWQFYLSDVIASFFSVLSIIAYSYHTLAFPIYIFLINLSGVILILSRTHHQINA